MARPFSGKSDEQVMCRAALHAWEWAEKTEEDEKFRTGIPGTRIVWVCDRECGAIKYQVFSPVTGHPVTSPSIKYSENYQLEPGVKQEYSVGELKDQARLELLRRYKP